MCTFSVVFFQVLHVIGVYLGLLGFVYITQTAGSTTQMAIVAVGALCKFTEKKIFLLSACVKFFDKKKYTKFYLFFLFSVGNILVFMLRVAFEVTHVKFREEEYSGK